MNPNSISHRLFAAALANGGQSAVKRSEARPVFRSPVKFGEAKKSVGGAAARKLSEWSWSGWQNTTI
jgi:hypothetical protein